MILRLRLLIVVPFIIYAVYNSSREDQTFKRNRPAQEKLRHAKSIESAWSAGVFASSLPSQKPGEAEELLNDVVRSEADVSVKKSAEELLNSMKSRSRFFQFAGHLTDFSDEFDSFRKLVRGNGLQTDQAAGQSEPSIREKFLIVVARRHDSHRPSDQDDPLFFDPDMVDAAGPMVAMKPAEVRTIIALYFGRLKVGDYRLKFKGREDVATGPSSQPLRDAFVHFCDVETIHVAGRAPIRSRRFVAEDPDSMELTLSSSRRPPPADGYDSLRTTVKVHIKEVTQNASE